MINTTQITNYNLTLSAEQFDVLHELIDDTISEISDNIEDTDLELNDYELYQIWSQMNRFREEDKFIDINNTGGKY